MVKSAVLVALHPMYILGCFVVDFEILKDTNQHTIGVILWHALECIYVRGMFNLLYVLPLEGLNDLDGLLVK